LRIILAESPLHLDEARRLFEEYGASLPPDLWFEDFRQELDGLPGDYGPPFGRLLLAIAEDNAVVGCVALRRLQPGIGEMKRMFVRPGHRGIGLGKRLAAAVLSEAAKIGYERIRLDTAPTMTEAIGLYEALGFRRIEPYRHYSIDEIVCMDIVLNTIQGHLS
jgi:ribosomal protein S18 acetylase RimI-like enzyme